MIGWHSSLFYHDNVVWSFLLKLYRLTLAGLLWFILNTLPMLFFIAVGLSILVLFIALHLFALMSIKTGSMKDFLKLTLYLSIKHPATTITVLVVVILWFLSIHALPASIVFSAVIACILTAMFLKSFYKHMGFYIINDYGK